MFSFSLYFGSEFRQVWSKTEDSRTYKSLGPIVGDNTICLCIIFPQWHHNPPNQIKMNLWFISLSLKDWESPIGSTSYKAGYLWPTHGCTAPASGWGPCGCLCKLALQDVPNWLSIFKRLLPLRSLHFLKVSMIKVFMPSYKENVQPLNVGVPAHLHLLRPTSVHTHLAPTQCYSQPHRRFLTLTPCALFNRFLEYPCNILLPLLSLANSFFKTEFSSNLPSLWRSSLIFLDTLIQFTLSMLHAG